MTDNASKLAQMMKYHVFCCTTQRPPGAPRPSCGAVSNDLINYMWEKVTEMELEGVRVNPSMCLGVCDAGPAMVIYPEGAWYKIQSKTDIDEIIDTHLVRGKLVDRLLLNPAA